MAETDHESEATNEAYQQVKAINESYEQWEALAFQDHRATVDPLREAYAAGWVTALAQENAKIRPRRELGGHPLTEIWRDGSFAIEIADDVPWLTLGYPGHDMGEGIAMEADWAGQLHVALGVAIAQVKIRSKQQAAPVEPAEEGGGV
jgi:hypothetical protein